MRGAGALAPAPRVGAVWPIDRDPPCFECGFCVPIVGGPMGDARYMYTAGIPAARVGSLLARARNAAGLSDRDLAATMRVHPKLVRQWEQGEVVPNDDQVELIA